MTGKQVYKIWAPQGKKWVEWVRPVPFVTIGEYSKNYNVSDRLPVVDFKNTDFPNTAVIVDLPGEESVQMGIALAKIGYRPIPIYNGTMEQYGARATVDNQSVGIALVWGASKLVQIEIGDDAMPAFLLDSNRMNRYKMDTSLFDNSWDIYHQDIPTPEYFLNNGINRILVIGERISKDLGKILYEFQRKKIEICLKKGYEEPKKVTVKRPLRKERD